MKQVIQNYKTGELELAEVAVPALKSGGILVENRNSLVSAGTEKLMIGLAKKSLLGKAKARPDLVKKVIKKIKSDGILEAYKQAMGRLDSPMPLGYSCAGVIKDVANNITGFQKGDRVACFGSEYASHAEIVYVPENLFVKIPENVSFEEAAFVGVGAIALHSVRCADVRLGENVAVIGLGLLGLIGSQILKAAGCNVFGIDLDESKLEIGKSLGIDSVAKPSDNIEKLIKEFTEGNGVDSTIIFASTESNQPLEQAASISRDRANIVVPGMVGLDIPRKIFYEKELNLVVSRSTGPGIYDPEYEEKGKDYPISYVRWTERRNMKEFLELIAKEKIDLKSLITHRLNIEKALDAYEMIMENKEPYIGVILNYDAKKEKDYSSKIIIKKKTGSSKMEGSVRIGMIGAGQYAKGTLLPAIKKVKIPYQLIGVATASGYSGKHAAKKYGFNYSTTDYKEILDDEDINLVLITTRHGSHAKFVLESLKAGKNVFVEKPLCLNESELHKIIEIYNRVNSKQKSDTEDLKSEEESGLATHDSRQLLLVGFNRRFSGFSTEAKEHFGKVNAPVSVNCVVNAGEVPADSWIYDPEEGGGRIIGEVCHFIDLIQFFSDSQPESVFAETLNNNSESSGRGDNVVATIKMKNGSVGTVTYVSNGDKSYPRERIKVFGKGSVIEIDNFRSYRVYKAGKVIKKKSLMGINRGHKEEMNDLFRAVKEGNELHVSFRDNVYTTLTTFAIEESIINNKPIDIDL